MTAWRTLLTAAALLALWPAGCTGPERVTSTPPQAVGDVDDILVLADPVAANWDGQVGSDGLDVGVLLFRHDRKLPVTVKGTLELRLYEGVVRAEDLSKARPLRTWRFDSAQLRSLLGRTPAGWGYALRLPWGPKTWRVHFPGVQGFRRKDPSPPVRAWQEGRPGRERRTLAPSTGRPVAPSTTRPRSCRGRTRTISTSILSPEVVVISRKAVPAEGWKARSR